MAAAPAANTQLTISATALAQAVAAIFTAADVTPADNAIERGLWHLAPLLG